MSLPEHRRPAPADPADFELYGSVLDRLIAHRIPFMVGGAYAFHRHTGIERHTRDFDVFVLPEHGRRVLERLAGDGYRTWLPFPHWLGKVGDVQRYVDVIFGSGNGIARVDSGWFDHATPDELFGHPVLLCPIEEMIWSKAFVMERERFDGADVVHLIQAGAARMDWDRLLARFGPHGPVLLAHLVLFGFVYPRERDLVPREVIDRLIAALRGPDTIVGHEPLCLGTLLSRSQYVPDLERGYRDGRLPPAGTLLPEDIERWTAAAEEQLPHEDAGPPRPSS